MLSTEIKNKLWEYLTSKGFPERSLYYYAEQQTYNAWMYNLAVKDEDELIEIYIFKESLKGKIEIETLQEKDYSQNKNKFVNVFWVILNDVQNLEFRLVSGNAVGSVTTFQRYLKNLNSLDMTSENINNSKTAQQFYRGQGSIGWSLLPPIYRETDKQRGINEEREMFYEAIRHCPSDFPSTMSTFDKLVKMQHYALPTRLLDITTNPLVALYFACQNTESKYAEVMIFDVPKKDVLNFEDKDVVICSNIVKQPNTFTLSDLQGDVLRENPQVVIGSFQDLQKVVCVLPKLNNPRISHQQGAFFLFGIRQNTKELSATLNIVPRRIIINTSNKKRILYQLSICGIDQSTLFPELDKVLSCIKSKV